MGKLTFSKAERLSREKWIKELFEKGSSFHLSPFRVIFLPHPQKDYPVHQVLISVSARNFKLAIARNTLKRRIREGYRLNKSKIDPAQKWLIAYIYIAKETLPSEVIHKKLALTLERLHWKEYEKEN